MTYEQRTKLALLKIQQIGRERELLNGHFSKIAKQYSVKVKDLKKAYQEAAR